MVRPVSEENLAINQIPSSWGRCEFWYAVALRGPAVGVIRKSSVQMANCTDIHLNGEDEG